MCKCTFEIEMLLQTVVLVKTLVAVIQLVISHTAFETYVT